MDSTFPPLPPEPKPSEPAAVKPVGPGMHLLNRIFNRHLMNAAVLMTLPVIFTLTLNPAREFMKDPDIWWHLADARILCTTHHFMHTVPNSFTVAGVPWVIANGFRNCRIGLATALSG